VRRIPDRDTLLGRCDSPDPKEAVSFYTQLFGWKARQTIGADSSGKYCGDVAAAKRADKVG